MVHTRNKYNVGQLYCNKQEIKLHSQTFSPCSSSLPEGDHCHLLGFNSRCLAGHAHVILTTSQRGGHEYLPSRTRKLRLRGVKGLATGHSAEGTGRRTPVRVCRERTEAALPSLQSVSLPLPGDPICKINESTGAPQALSESKQARIASCLGFMNDFSSWAGKGGNLHLTEAWHRLRFPGQPLLPAPWGSGSPVSRSSSPSVGICRSCR